jgi:hypothetical protein
LASIPKEQNWNDPDTQYMHSEFGRGSNWVHPDEAEKVPKSEWQQRWLDAGKRFAEYQERQEQEEDEEW